MSTEGMDLVTQHIVMQRDLNAHGNLFGGIVLAWLDEAAAIYGMDKIGYTNIVTVNMDDVNFKTPGKNGDILQVFATIDRIGKSSFTVRTSCVSIGRMSRTQREVITCKITFVCLDEMGNPFPYFQKNPLNLNK